MSEKDKKLSLADILKSSKEPICEINVEGLQPINLYKLTNQDMLELDEVKGDLERNFKLLYLMLKKNDPSITYEQILAMPADLSVKVSNAIMEYSSSFLPQPRRLREASAPQKPSESSSSAESMDSNPQK